MSQLKRAFFGKLVGKLMGTLIAVYCGLVQGAQFNTDLADGPYLQAAAGSIDITPPLGSYMAGYGADRKSTGRFDSIFAKTVVVLEPGVDARGVAIVTVDYIGLTRPDILQIQQGVRAQIEHLNVVVSSTHTHAGPDVVGIWGPALWRSGRDEAYIDSVVVSTIELVTSTYARVTDVTSYVASASIDLDWVKNLSEPGLLDRQLSVMQFVSLEGETIATLANFACHPTVLGPDNTRVSADFLTGYYNAMNRRMGGEHLFLQGAIGGWVQPLQGDRSIDLARQYGRELATDTLMVLESKTLNSQASIGYVDRDVDIELENWGFRLLIGLGVLQRELVGGWLGMDAMRTNVAYFEIGEAAFVTHPGETSPAYSLASRVLMDSPYPFVMGLSQDAIGYILKPDYFSNPQEYPHAEYLTSVSVGSEAGEHIMLAIKQLINEFDNKDAD